MNFDDIISATMGPSIVSEQHDKSKINVDTTVGSWDAAEYGMTREQAMVAQRPQLVASANRRANLGVTGGRINYAGANTVPWHGLGVTVDRAMSSREALALAGLANWGVAKVQNTVTIPGYPAQLAPSWSVVRTDSGAVLGTVGARYDALSNEDAFGFLDSVVGANTRYETAGAIGAGEKYWLLASMPSMDVDGDQTTPYILFAGSHDGSGATRIVCTSVRVVCANTRRLALAGGTGISIRHTRNQRAKIDAARRALGLAGKAVERSADEARRLISTPDQTGGDYFKYCLDDILDCQIAGERVTKASLDDGSALAAILDLGVAEQRAARKALDKAVERRETLLAEILQRHSSPTCESGRGSLWSSYNAVSETLQHSEEFRYRGSDRARAETRFEQTLDGRVAETTDLVYSRALGLAM